MFPGMRQRLKVCPGPLKGKAPGVVEQNVAQRTWNCAGKGQLDICYVLFRCWRANSDGWRISTKSTHRLPKTLAILNEATETEGHCLNLLSCIEPAVAISSLQWRDNRGRPSHVFAAHMSRAAHWPAPLECAKQQIANRGDCDQTNRKKDGLIGVAAPIEQPSRDRRSGRGDEKITAEENAHSESAALGRNRFGCQRHDDAGGRRTHQSERQ